MHIHILGICGTFMGGVAQLAAAAGHRVTGADAGVYPPMSEQLAQAGIEVIEGWDPRQLEPVPDLVVIGNAMTRGNPAVEAVLDRDLPYTSGPAWLGEHVLRGRHVLAVAGTHGKTTTASMLARILADAGHDPGFLIGGVPRDFGVSARAGSGAYFVIEADEYDTAFFDKRSKFVHYRPRTLVLNNLEFDHADIFDDLAAIQRQFHHLVRIVPGTGRILVNAADAPLAEVLALGCWTPCERFVPPANGAATGGIEAEWRTEASADGSHFRALGPAGEDCEVDWSLVGAHNVTNAIAAMAAAAHVGVPLDRAAAALSAFSGVSRRLEERARVNGIVVHDDFAHHPTAIATTLAGLRARVGEARILVALDPASNTMRSGIHGERLASALMEADQVFLHGGGVDWDFAPLHAALGQRLEVHPDPAALAVALATQARPGDHVVLMSNGGFGGLARDVPVRLAAAGRNE